jgi:hypothetical protein
MYWEKGREFQHAIGGMILLKKYFFEKMKNDEERQDNIELLYDVPEKFKKDIF